MTKRKQTQVVRNKLGAPVLDELPVQAATLKDALDEISATPDNFLVRLGLDAVPLEIGLALKSARLSAGLKQAELAELAKVPQGAISEIEHGKGRDGPSYRTIRMLADALGAQIELKSSHHEDESDEQSLRALAKDSALVLVDVAAGMAFGSLVRALIDKSLWKEVINTVSDLGEKSGKQAASESSHGGFWRLDPHVKAKLAMPESTVYLVYEGAAEIRASHMISGNLCIAGPNERVALANTGAKAASVLTMPVGALNAVH